ncbi:hypothetical protein G5B10_13240 [Fluviicola sp. SGL-29]|nr:hypothetical protein [Fluviicola sp. SGL-29]
MNFYQKKVGRPTIEESALIDAIEQIVTRKGIPHEEIPNCETLEDLIVLRQFVESYSVNEPVETTEQETHEETQAEELIEAVETESVTEDVFTHDEEVLKEVLADESPDFVATDYEPFSQPVIERSYTSGERITSESEQEHEEDVLLEEAKEKTPLDDLPPVTKKRAAEQTADALLKGYARLVPEPFKWFSKISEEKVEQMAFDGELDLSIEVSEGLTFDEYVRQTNEQIDEVFEVQEETLEEIREPLIEVLMEQELELTPTQRLTMAVLSHLIQMFTVALKLRKQNNRILAYQQHLTHLYSQRAKTAA